MPSDSWEEAAGKLQWWQEEASLPHPILSSSGASGVTWNSAGGGGDGGSFLLPKLQRKRSWSKGGSKGKMLLGCNLQ